MKDGPDIARVAALIGDPARANMLTALMSGKALTASELSVEAGVSAPTASAHLAKLEAGGLVTTRPQGRHKYFSIGGDEVARVLEGLMGLAAGTGQLRSRPGPREPALRHARVCYNHLAGDMGIRLYGSLRARGCLRTGGDRLELTEIGRALAGEFGIDVERLQRGRTPLCRECLDWSERRSHLAGSLGRAFLARIEELGWASRQNGNRAVSFTRRGEEMFAAAFPLSNR